MRPVAAQAHVGPPEPSAPPRGCSASPSRRHSRPPRLLLLPPLALSAPQVRRTRQLARGLLACSRAGLGHMAAPAAAATAEVAVPAAVVLVRVAWMVRHRIRTAACSAAATALS